MPTMLYLPIPVQKRDIPRSAAVATVFNATITFLGWMCSGFRTKAMALELAESITSYGTRWTSELNGLGASASGHRTDSRKKEKTKPAVAA